VGAHMQLYHYTEPSIYLHIAYQGLLPHCKGLNAPMTGGEPVVWLTKEASNLATAASIAEVANLFGGEPLKRKVGEPIYGGTARFTVHLDRADRKLVRYADFLHETGSAAILKLLSRAARTSWWIYRGTIPPHKIEPIDVATMLACLDWHIETHPDMEVRAQFAAQREKIKDLPADTRIDLTIQRSTPRSEFT
jgi:hypothetical protein